MKQLIASVFFDILSYTIGNIIFCIFKFNNYNCKGKKTSVCRSKLPILFNIKFNKKSDYYIMIAKCISKLNKGRFISFSVKINNKKCK